MNIEERNKIVEDNMGLVYSITKKFHTYHRELEFDDLIQIGSIGLLKAVEKFDKTKDNTLSTLAYNYIYGYIKNYFSSQSFIYIPRHKFAEIMKLNILETKLKTRLGHEPTTQQIAEAAGITIEQCINLRDIRRKMSHESLDQQIEVKDVFLHHQIADPNNFYDTVIDKMSIQTAMSSLKQNEQKFIKMKFLQGCSVQEIAEITNCTRQHVNQTINKGLAIIKRNLKN